MAKSKIRRFRVAQKCGVKSDWLRRGCQWTHLVDLVYLVRALRRLVGGQPRRQDPVSHERCAMELRCLSWMAQEPSIRYKTLWHDGARARGSFAGGISLATAQTGPCFCSRRCGQGGQALTETLTVGPLEQQLNAPELRSGCDSLTSNSHLSQRTGHRHRHHAE